MGAGSISSTGPAVNFTSPKMVLADGILTIRCNLQRADYTQFQRICNQLCSSAIRDVTLDISHSTYASSLFIGILVDSITRMKSDGKNVTVLVSPEIGHLLHMAHLYHLFAYQIVEPPADA